MPRPFEKLLSWLEFHERVVVNLHPSRNLRDF
jgi:hypothetical protein